MNPSNAGAGRKKIAVIFCLLALLISACLLLGSCGDNKTPDTPDKPDTGDVTPTPDDAEKPDDTDKPDPEPEEKKQEFTLTFMIEGEVYKTFKVKEGDTFTDLPDLPEFPGYIGSWRKYSLENIQGNMVIEADYTPVAYTLTFDYADATEGTETASTEITYDDVIGTLPTPKKERYTFDGWYIGEDKIDRYTRWEYTENKTATAHFVDYYSEGLSYVRGGSGDYELTGIGTCTDTDIIVPATYEGMPVTSVRYAAFENNTQITSVSFGENVYFVGNYVFRGCTSLRSVTFLHTAGLSEGFNPSPSSYGYHMFEGCTALEDLTVPTYILAPILNSNNFYGNLKRLTTTAGDTFPRLLNMSELETVVINEGVRTMEYGTFMWDPTFSSHESHLTSVTLPESLTEIPGGAFCHCRALTSVKIGKNVTSISASAFGDTAENLVIELSPENTSFTYKDGCLIEKASGTLLLLKGNYVLPTDGSLKVISGGVFSEFDLTEILIPASVTTIESGAFAGCENLKKFIVADGSLLSVCPSAAFESTPEIAKVPLAVVSSFTRAKELTVIGSGAFDTDFSDARVERLILGDGITSVGKSVLANNKTIQYVKLGSGITSIGKEAFYNSSLTEIDLSEGLLTIGESAFKQCYSLEEITIPSSVTSIGEDAFFINQNYGTPALSRVNISDVEKWASISFANAYANPLAAAHYLYQDGRMVSSVTFYTLTKIGDYAFELCHGLTSVYFEPTVQEIGKYAFEGCIRLRTADFMRSAGETNPLIFDEGAFRACYSLPGLTRAENLTKVGSKVFNACYSMVEFTVPASVTEFASDVFDYASNMREVTNLSSSVPDSVFGSLLLAAGEESKLIRQNGTIFYQNYLIGTYSNGGFADNYTLPTDVNGNAYYICSRAFTGTPYKYITIPANAKIADISGYAFAYSEILSLTVRLEQYLPSYMCYGCRNLETVALVGGIVGDHAFDSCTSLVELNLGNVTRIEGSAFIGCTSLVEVTLPSTLGSIESGTDQFRNCTSLTRVVISEGIMCLPSYIFSGCTSLVEVTLPSTLTKFNGMGMFGGCTSLTKIVIPEGVTSLPSGIFSGCTSLVEVTLPSTLRSFASGGDQFKNCTSLTKIVIPEGVTSLSSYIFAWCSNLSEVVLPSTITSIDSCAFFRTGSATSGLHIYFAGTEDAWNAVSGLDNAELPKNVTYHFESTGPEDTEA